MIQHSEGSVHLVYETPLGIGHKFPFNELLNGGLDERIHCSKSLKIQQDVGLWPCIISNTCLTCK